MIVLNASILTAILINVVPIVSYLSLYSSRRMEQLTAVFDKVRAALTTS